MDDAGPCQVHVGAAAGEALQAAGQRQQLLERLVRCVHPQLPESRGQLLVLVLLVLLALVLPPDGLLALLVAGGQRPVLRLPSTFAPAPLLLLLLHVLHVVLLLDGAVHPDARQLQRCELLRQLQQPAPAHVAQPQVPCAGRQAAQQYLLLLHRH